MTRRFGGIFGGIVVHLFVGTLHHPANVAMNLDQCVVELAVGGQPDIAPIRKRRVDAPRQRRQHPREMLLDHAAVALQRARVFAECERARHIDRIAFQFLRHVEHAALSRRTLQTRMQPSGDRVERRKERLDIRHGQRLHHEPAVRLPSRAFGGEHAVAADLFEHGFELPQTPVAMRPLARHPLRKLGVGDHDDGPRADPEAIGRTEFFRPALQDQMELRGFELKRIAEERQALRMRQIGNLSGRRACARQGAHDLKA